MFANWQATLCIQFAVHTTGQALYPLPMQHWLIFSTCFPPPVFFNCFVFCRLRSVPLFKAISAVLCRIRIQPHFVHRFTKWKLFVWKIVEKCDYGWGWYFKVPKQLTKGNNRNFLVEPENIVNSFSVAIHLVIAKQLFILSLKNAFSTFGSEHQL